EKRLLHLPGHPQVRLHFGGTPLQFLLGLFAPRDVVADADDALELAAYVAQRYLRGERPADFALGAEVGFLLVDNRRAAEHLPIVGHGLLAALTGKEVERGVADRGRLGGQPE